MTIEGFIKSIYQLHPDRIVVEVFSLGKPTKRAWSIIHPGPHYYVSHEPYTQHHLDLFCDDMALMLQGKTVYLIDRSHSIVYAPASPPISLPEGYRIQELPFCSNLSALFKTIFPDDVIPPPREAFCQLL